MTEQEKVSSVAPAATRGKTIIEDIVVAKLAGLSTREVSGVASVGAPNRMVDALRDTVQSSPSLTRGISVSVSEDEAQISIGIIATYGVRLQELAQLIRENVIGTVEKITGLGVKDVTITIHDIQIDTDEDSSEES
ncbi:MAG: Asp23/Gls24 family envelope stress response protein [Corynebacterium sp.]|nr:Asp23/Gls24 family envelope stress response protein [Corynebacterium sp.]